jgi:hypothetical protein
MIQLRTRKRRKKKCLNSSLKSIKHPRERLNKVTRRARRTPIRKDRTGRKAFQKGSRNPLLTRQLRTKLSKCSMSTGGNE